MKSTDAHWTAIAGFWLAILGIIATVVIGVLELKKEDREPRRGGGKRSGVERGGQTSGEIAVQPGDEDPGTAPAE